MALSNDLISKFVNLAKDNNKSDKKETIVYGSVSKIDATGQVHVKLDGAEGDYTELPITDTVEVEVDDRVIVTIKNHSAIITSNLSKPSGSKNTASSINAKADKAISDSASAKTDAKAAADKVTELNTLVAKKVDTTEFTAKVAAIENLTSDSILTDTIRAIEGDIGTLETDNVTINDTLRVQGEVIATKITAGEVAATYATIAELNTVKGNIETLDTDLATIDDLIFGTATGATINTNFANQVIAQIGNAQIKDAMIDTVSANKITALNLLAGTISTNNVTISSSDGGMKIYDNTIQIKDTNQTVRVQIGKDASNDYSINIWDADGKLMFSEGGITGDAIKEAIIRNDMVAADANIHGSKLDIDSLFEEINDDGTNTIKSTKIYLDDKGQTLDVAFKSLATTDSVDGLTETVTTQGTQIAANTNAISTKIWQQDINTAKNEMSTQYSTLEQELDGVSATVSSHTSQIASKAENTTVTAINNKVTNIETNLSGFQSTVSDMYATKTELSNTSEILEVSGRNLIVRRGELVDTYVAASGDVIDGAGYYSSTMLDYIRVTPGQAYTFSKAVDNLYFRYAWYDENFAVIGRTAVEDKVHTWTAPSNAAYLRVSYPNTDDASSKLEKGSEATAYCAAIEDVSDVIDKVDSKFDNYSTTSVMNSTINQKADSIISSVSSTYTTKSEFNNLQIGGCNLIQNSDFSNGTDKWVVVGITAVVEDDATHGKRLSLTTPSVGSSSYRIYPSTTGNFIHKGGTYTLSFYAKADTNTTIQTNVAGSPDPNRNCSVTTSWQRFNVTYAADSGSITFWLNEVGPTVYLAKVKMEHGNKVTDWTPAPEDMATDADLSAVETRVSSAETKITQNSNSITSQASSISSLGTRMSTVEQTATSLTARLDTTDANVLNAAKTATNYLNFSSSGLIVGDHTASTLGQNIRLSNSTVDIRNGNTVLASYGANTIYLGKNSETATINLCNGSATMKSIDEYDFQIYTDKRLVMKAYDSMLIDCWRDLTHQTRISVQSADPDNASRVGSISAWVYKDTIQNTFTISNGTTIFDITDGTNTTTTTLSATEVDIRSKSAQINCTNGLHIGCDGGSYAPKITLGYDPLQSKAIRWYWSDYALHDAFSNSNGQYTFVGPGDIDETTTTAVRGKYVRLYAHSGGAVYLGYSGSTAVTSDRNLKTDIYDIDDKYMDFFDRLRPITYKYDGPNNKGHRDHVGFIAQEVEEALIASGLTTEQFAGLIIENDVTMNPNYDSGLTDEDNAANEEHYDTLYSLRYEEFISLLVKKVQSLQDQINQLRSN